jgi:hypothetical protein
MRTEVHCGETGNLYPHLVSSTSDCENVPAPFKKGSSSDSYKPLPSVSHFIHRHLLDFGALTMWYAHTLSAAAQASTYNRCRSFELRPVLFMKQTCFAEVLFGVMGMRPPTARRKWGPVGS